MPGLNLTREEAQQRSSVINVDTYSVVLDLTQGEKTFRSTSTIVFEAVSGSATFVDLVADKLHSVRLNSEELDVDLYHDYRFPLEGLKKRNVLEVDGDFVYMHTGEGLHRSVDPADGKVYLYSQFEVPDARRVFPTFEQPDLKASFAFSVIAPKDWRVFSVAPTPVPTEQGDALRFDFASSERISTYITAIVAGPYEGKTATIRSVDGREVELGVYCRASLIDYLDADRIIDITERGFDFFENAYGVPYPFMKYDQIFVPEYNAGAMENAGCVTFRDQYIFRATPTEWQLESRTNTILHELAHMWFGDLVTMQWWDDLWLNESFAEFMAHLATAEATEWSDAWVGFMVRKEWGLAQDQKPSTHPIRANIRDLEDVEVNFDGITYAKGAAVLRQMVAYVGREDFFKGLNRYLEKYSFANATLDDLLKELEAASGRDMDHWTKVWLEESGVNVLRPELQVNEDGTIASLEVIQESFNAGASLRPHRLIVAGYGQSADGTRVEKLFSQELDVDGDRTEVTEIVGLPKPDLLLVNDQDLAYAKIRMDSDSLAFATHNITRFDDALTRRILLAAAWDMTRDGEMSASAFLDLALEDLRIEDNIAACSALLQQIDLAVTSYVSPENRPHQLQSVAQRLVALAWGAKAGSDEQRMFTQALTRRAVSPEQYAFVEQLFTGEKVMEGLEVGPDLRWDMLFALVRGGLAGEEQIAILESEDQTLTGKQNAARARATVNSDEVKASTWAAIMHDVSIPNDTRWAMAQGFWAHARTDASAYTKFVAPFFAELTEAWDAHTFHIASRLVQHMFPDLLAGYVPDLDLVGQATQWLAQNEERPDALKRLILEGRSDVERMLNAQNAD